jgi:hypothetical protein
MQILPRSEWQFVIPGAHRGYIDWERFEANQQRLLDNSRAYGIQRRSGPVREGPALLQGRVLCGLCGERMGVHYSREHGRIVPVYVCQESTVRRGGKICQSIPGKIVDPAIGALLIELMTPMTLGVTLAVQRELEARTAETDALRRQHLERLRYEADLARRRFMKVDPDNRLVADALEAEWNEKLRLHTDALTDYERRSRDRIAALDAQARQRILDLANQFPAVWNDPRVEPRERKRILRLLVDDVTLIKTEVITAHVRLRGGDTRTLRLDRPVPIAQIPQVQAGPRRRGRQVARPALRSPDRRYPQPARLPDVGGKALQLEESCLHPDGLQAAEPLRAVAPPGHADHPGGRPAFRGIEDRGPAMGPPRTDPPVLSRRIEARALAAAA